jgi:hypothetical protein
VAVNNSRNRTGQSNPGVSDGQQRKSSAAGIQCYKCRDHGHETKKCTVKVVCLVCGNEAHMTVYCTWPEQPKPTAKFVG